MKLMINNARLAFPSLFKATAFNAGDEPSYSATLLLTEGATVTDPATGKQTTIEDACDAVGAEKWGTKWAATKKELVAKDKMAYHDGNAKANYAGFEGNTYIATRAKVSARPTVIDQRRSPLTEEDGKPYAGCYVNASIELWAQDNNYGRRINAQIRGVQFARDGDAFAGGAPADANEFGEVAEGAGAEDLA